MSSVGVEEVHSAVVLADEVAVVYERGATPAVSGVSFRLDAGKGLLVSGPRGVGLTSLLRGVLGLVGHEGTLEVFGGIPGGRATVGRIGYGPQGWPIPPALSARAVLRMVTRLKGRPYGEADELGERVGLSDLNRAADRLQVEDVRRLSLACSLVGDPELLILDDPWEFPETVREVESALARGAACIAASHDPGGLPALLGQTLTIGGDDE